MFGSPVWGAIADQYDGKRVSSCIAYFAIFLSLALNVMLFYSDSFSIISININILEISYDRFGDIFCSLFSFSCCNRFVFAKIYAILACFSLYLFKSIRGRVCLNL